MNKKSNGFRRQSLNAVTWSVQKNDFLVNKAKDLSINEEINLRRLCSRWNEENIFPFSRNIYIFPRICVHYAINNAAREFIREISLRRRYGINISGEMENNNSALRRSPRCRASDSRKLEARLATLGKLNENVNERGGILPV